MRRRTMRVGLLIESVLLATAMLVGISAAVVHAFGQTSGLVAQSGAITLRDAMDRTRSFVGNPALNLRGGADPASEAGLARPMFLLESGEGEQVDEFRVDGQSGEILEATFRSRLPASRGDRPATLEDSAVIAASYAASRYVGFDTLTLIERSETPTRTIGSIYTLKWVQVEAATRAELPTSVTVSVASSNRNVVRYLAQRDPVTVSTTPDVGSEMARATAQAVLQQTSAWSDATLVTSRLQVVYDDFNRQRLAWALLYAPSAASPVRERVSMLVDAHSGEIIETH